MPYEGSWRRQHSRVLVFMFTDVIFIHQPGVMITDFKMLLLPVLFTSSDRTEKNYPQLMLIQAFGKLVNSCSFFLLIILLLSLLILLFLSILLSRVAGDDVGEED